MPNTSHYRIFDYWKDKFILSSGEVKTTQECKHSFLDEWVVEDWGEPCCWACGEHAIADEDLSRFFDEHADTTSPDFYKKLFSLKTVKSKLNRCHIHPNALGGVDSPENLFLMCEECHALSPDTTNRAAFFRWVYDRRKQYVHGRMCPGEMLKRVDEELARRGLPPMVECFKMVKSPYEFSDISEFMQDRVGFHCSGVTDSSMIVGITDWILHDWIRAILSSGN